MTKYPVPEKHIPMWMEIFKSLINAQDWLDEARARQDEGKIRVYMKMVSDRTSALGNLQQIIWGPMLESLAHRPGQTQRTVRTAPNLDPPEMLVFDSEEEYRAALDASIKAAAAEGKGVVDAHLNASSQPEDPEEY